MNHQKFNAEYLKGKAEAEEFEFVPNMKKRLPGEDYHLYGSKDEQGYESKKEKIIQDYLLKELPAKRSWLLRVERARAFHGRTVQ